MERMQKGLLIIMSGPSGVGKGTIRREVMKDGNTNLVYSISMTTRYQRAGEQNGVDYYFVSKEDFLKAIEHDELLEWAEFVGNFYGTPKDVVFDKINRTVIPWRNMKWTIKPNLKQCFPAFSPQAICIWVIIWVPLPRRMF